MQSHTNPAQQGILPTRESSSASGENSLFARIIESYVRPLIHGSSVTGPLTGDKDGQRFIEQENPCRLILRPGKESAEYVVLERPIAFAEEEKAFLERLVLNIAHYPLETFRAYPFLIGGAVERAIAWSINPEHADTVYQILQVYTQWASETHEGKRTSHTTGIYFDRAREGGRTLYEARGNGCLKTLGSTKDTLLAIGKDGSILGMELVSAKLNNYKKDRDILAPIGSADIAVWTNSRRKAAISLNEHGDILVFKEKRLVYAKRRSFWRSFPHALILREAIPPSLGENEQKSRKAVYLTALDIAMTRRGGCLGIFPRSASGTDGLTELLRPETLFESSTPSEQAKLLADVVDSRKFFEIPRILRADLCSLDGALIIDDAGTILTAGAIVKTNGNSATGGGRSAAAKALARNGFGIKISSDGYIEIYDGENLPVYFA